MLKGVHDIFTIVVNLFLAIGRPNTSIGLFEIIDISGVVMVLKL
jgi:hypothetical protein